MNHATTEDRPHNGAATLPFTEAPPAAIEAPATCEHCAGPFTPRAASGGKPQRFCSETCRKAFHAAAGAQRTPQEGAAAEGAANTAEQPTATQRRAMPIPGCADAEATKDPALILAETLERIEQARAQEKQTKAEAQDDNERDMWRPDNEDVILRAQPATCVYWNDYNQLVVKQEAHWSQEDEPFLTFEPHLLPAVIHKLTTEYESWKRDHT